MRNQNKAKIQYLCASNKANEKIVLSFTHLPDMDIARQLELHGFAPSGNTAAAQKKWVASSKTMPQSKLKKVKDFLVSSKLLKGGLGSLGAAYIPASMACNILNTITPDSMDYEIHIAVRKIKADPSVGNFQEYLMKKLNYSSEELCRSLSAEQIDAVVLAIYNIEKKKQGMIIGDQTGIGKGRVAAAMIRYGRLTGLKPIFLSERPNLFSDMYRDLVDIGSSDLVPFIINGREAKTHVKDQDGNIVYEALAKTEQEDVLRKKKVPQKYDYVMATYSQFNSPEKKYVKPDFLLSIARNNILIMDEAHNASGSSNTGEFMQKVLAATKGVTFLSATFAKRPDNMPIYAMKTAMSETNMSNEQLVDAITAGGVALQEVLSSQLVSEGQMIRRERSFEGVEVNYISLDDKAEEHIAVADNVTEIIRDIIKFQEDFISEMVDDLDDIVAGEYGEVEERKGTKGAGVDMPPMFSKVFNLINQMLFSIKAASVAERAIERLREGKKPIIAFASTMGAFLEQMENEKGEPVGNGDTIISDFKEVLMRALRGVMRYTVTKPKDGSDPDDDEMDKQYKFFQVSELPPEAQMVYLEITNKINKASTGISISPIDVIVSMIEDAGYSVAEVTGRKMEVLPIKGQPTKGLVQTRSKIPVNDAFRMYNNNERDCLLINQSGATGASAHAIVTNTVPAEDVKQRVMVILQAELDINKEVQKRGRINRTGQISLPIYDYVNSAIPAEKRLMMMLKKKLKSLDANTTSNQKNSGRQLESSDFLNKYGDKIVTFYLLEDEALWKKLGDPLKFDDENKPKSADKVNIIEGAAHKVSGRVAILSVKEQEKFYNDVIDRYEKYIEYLKQTDAFDLEVETMNLEAETREQETCIAGKGGGSSFSKDSILEKCMVNNLRKPFTKDELDNMITKKLDGNDPETLHEQVNLSHQTHSAAHLEGEIAKQKTKYYGLVENIVNEKKYLKLKTDTEKQDFYDDRKDTLEDAQIKAIEKERNVNRNRRIHLDNILDFFMVGAGYNWPEETVSAGQDSIKCVFLGYSIDMSKPNPFTPSAVQAHFAVASSVKYITLAASGEQGEKIQSIIGLSRRLSSYDRKDVVERWDKHVQSFSTARVLRYIVTGNVLQAFSKYKGKLVSYTRDDKSVAKGILMASSWSPGTNQGGGKEVTVPIGKAKKIIAGLSSGQSIMDADKKISISKGWSNYTFSMPKTRGFKQIFTDPDVVYQTENKRDGFNMQSGYMRAYVSEGDMDTLINILQAKHSLNVVVSQTMFDQFVDKNDEKIERPGATKAAEKLYAEDKVLFEDKIRQSSKSDMSGSAAKARVREKAKAKARARARLRMLKILRGSKLSGIKGWEL